MAIVLAFAAGSTALAQTQEKPAPPVMTMPTIRHTPEPVTPLKVQIVLARYQGEKKLSSMPYALTMNAGGKANIRMGTRIPITMLAMANAPKDAPVTGPVQYQDVGTNIDCNATEVEGGRYSLTISIDDTSVYPEDQAGSIRSSPSFRSFRAGNTIVLKSGETGQFTTATDKVTGETVRVDATLTVQR
jgi:type II secretory pathway component GspD/PulD (secretin)